MRIVLHSNNTIKAKRISEHVKIVCAKLKSIAGFVMQIRCKENITDEQDTSKIIFVKDKLYEARIVCDDLLAIDEFNEEGLIAIQNNKAQAFSITFSENQWDTWFNDHFEIIFSE